MKRDLYAFSLGLFIMLLSCLAAVRHIVPAMAVTAGNQTPVLILDAGHGGEDGGASTAAGDKESDINLDIVLKLESLLAFLGIDTVLTRSEDISVYDEGCETLREKKVSDLRNRVSLVQNTPGAMLLSVHQNTFTDSRYHGMQVFFGSGEISSQWGSNTQRTAQAVLDANNTRKATAIPDHVYIFQHIDCPAILVECGFLSNGEEAALLLTDTYQRKIAVTLAGSYIHQLQMIPSPLGGD